MRFHVAPYRFIFRAGGELLFPRGTAANSFRGGLGAALRRASCGPSCPGAKLCAAHGRCAYSRFFEPVLEGGPSGLADPPRPFVLRPRFPEGQPLAAGSLFHLDIHLFDVTSLVPPLLISALSSVARQGLGPRKVPAELASVFSLDTEGRSETCVFANGQMLARELPAPLQCAVDNADRTENPVSRLRIEFIRPVELKTEGALARTPGFAALAARVSGRIATLDRLYGPGEIRFDWPSLAEAASRVQLADYSIVQENATRRSGRTGQVHPLGGFTGWAEYEGELDPFVPLLRAGEWAGVGRQTVWGKGAYRVCETQREKPRSNRLA